jgi:glycosyltransferase involved in cell wall biosynthesis
MIHFFPTFSKDAANSPFAHALQNLGVEHKIFAGEVLLRYRHRIWLILIGLPKLGFFAIRSAWKSLVISNPKPEAVVVGSHLEALVFSAARCVLRRKTRIYLLGFILTRRKNALFDRVRRYYFEHLFATLNGILCHSSIECKRYDALFPRARGRFVFVPVGVHITGYEERSKFVDPAESYALSAGRSGRDYATLCLTFRDTGYPLHIVCDAESALANCTAAENIKMLKRCYDSCYKSELRNAGMVVIPIGVTDISAGQMVLIQAMAYRKPLIVTRTPTVEEYLTHELNALLIPPGDKEALRVAVDRLRNDKQLAARLTENGFVHYEEHHSMNAFVKHIVNAVTLHSA